ncbi:hypothetical protein OUZ56_019716 [Daphnia magna]|uniref:Uncharacterized protein n=1 Tax=Daphnia magna TaxID=35525 RepID=A0ABQ9ZCD7_9CRUS|nr:hypothetical protein OUZ56_019716 [Daphnia magna]
MSVFSREIVTSLTTTFKFVGFPYGGVSFSRINAYAPLDSPLGSNNIFIQVSRCLRDILLHGKTPHANVCYRRKLTMCTENERKISIAYTIQVVVAMETILNIREPLLARNVRLNERSYNSVQNGC